MTIFCSCKGMGEGVILAMLLLSYFNPIGVVGTICLHFFQWLFLHEKWILEVQLFPIHFKLSENPLLAHHAPSRLSYIQSPALIVSLKIYF